MHFMAQVISALSTSYLLAYAEMNDCLSDAKLDWGSGRGGGGGDAVRLLLPSSGGVASALLDNEDWVDNFVKKLCMGCASALTFRG